MAPPAEGSTRQILPPTGSLTQTHTTPSTEIQQNQTETHPPAILRLRGAHAPSNRSVTWRSDVVDNEGLNKKKSKGEPVT